MTHGLGYHPLYGLFKNMHQRCKDPGSSTYRYYGARGIRVCERWSGPDGLPNFLDDMGERPGPDYQLDRIDNDRDYEPGNCRRATRAQNLMNRRVVNETLGKDRIEVRVRLPRELNEQWVALAIATGRTRTDVVTDALTEYLARN
jgi:hypothetical protein